MKDILEKAESGDPLAQYLQAMQFVYAQDNQKALFWFKKAAEQGVAIAQHNVGVAYERDDRGVSTDFNESVKWYTKAAYQGYASSQCSMGLMYWRGEGVEKDKIKAYAWYCIASTNPNASSDDISRVNGQINICENGSKNFPKWKLTGEEISQGKSLAEELKKNISASETDESGISMKSQQGSQVGGSCLGVLSLSLLLMIILILYA